MGWFFKSWSHFNPLERRRDLPPSRFAAFSLRRAGLFAIAPPLGRLRSAGGPFKGLAHGARPGRAKAALPPSSTVPQAKRPLQGRKGNEMALYEHLLIARQDISAQQVDALATHLKTIVEGEGGKIEKQEYWGLRGLAYRIKKNRKGHYVLLNINAPAAAVIELERQLKINEDVLRYLTVKVDAFDTSSSKNRRDDNKAEKAEGEEENSR
jgi:small subunit ribosomal protein S6